MNSYGHHHKKRLADLRQMERARGKEDRIRREQRAEAKKLEKQMSQYAVATALAEAKRVAAQNNAASADRASTSELPDESTSVIGSCGWLQPMHVQSLESTSRTLQTPSLVVGCATETTKSKPPTRLISSVNMGNRKGFGLANHTGKKLKTVGGIFGAMDSDSGEEEEAAAAAAAAKKVKGRFRPTT